MTFGTNTTSALTTIEGRRLGLAPSGNLVANGLDLTPKAVNCTFTIGDEAANVRIILIQFTDANGVAVGEEVIYDLYVLNGSTNVLATGGSTGIADGGVGAILDTRVAKLIFECITDSTGLSDFDWTDTGTESVRLAVKLPNGVVKVSDAFANA